VKIQDGRSESRNGSCTPPRRWVPVLLYLSWLAGAGFTLAFPRAAFAQDEPAFRAVARIDDKASRPRVLPRFSAIARSDRDRGDLDRELSLSAGFELSRGDFNDSDRTEITFLPITLKYQNGPWIASLTVPYIRINGPGDVVGGTESSLVIGSDAAGRRTESGLGDVVTRVSYLIDPPTPAFPLVELTGRIKFPTADEDEGLGTGKADYSAQIDVSKQLGRFSAFGTLGYRVLGDPSGVDLDDGFLGSIGFGVRLSPRVSAGLAFDLREASTSGTDGSRELVPFTSFRWSDRWRIGTYGVFGLSDSSPDLGLGFSVRRIW